MPNVLVVDHDPDIRRLVCHKLDEAGHRTRAEADGEGALATIREQRPDLVLLAWELPRLTGLEVCRALRREPSTAALPVVLLTGRARQTDVDQGLAAGADDYVVKPFSPRELLARVDGVLAAAPL